MDEARIETSILCALCGLGAAYVGYESRWGKPQAWADASEVVGYPIGWHFSRKTVPWPEVAACEIETFYDPFGKPFFVSPTLKGWDGGDLMTLNLQYTNFEDQERLVDYIKARLPKSHVGFLE